MTPADLLVAAILLLVAPTALAVTWWVVKLAALGVLVALFSAMSKLGWLP